MGDDARAEAELAAPDIGGQKKRKRREWESAGAKDLKRVAEIVMVLSAMAEIRAGRDPTAAEKAMVAEARERLAAACEGVRPKDLFSGEAVRVLVEDLGLNRTRDPMLGFRPPKVSIAEKVLLTKKKMEETKESAPHSTVYTSQHLSAGFGANSESHSALLHGSSRFLSDRQSPVTLSAGSFQNAAPAVHIPALAAVPSSLGQSQVSQTQAAITPVKSSTTLSERGSHSLAMPHVDAAYHRLDTRINGQTYVTQVQAPVAPAYLPDKTPTTFSVQLPETLAKPGQANMSLDQTQVTSESALEAAQTSHQVMGNQEAKISAVQPVNLFIGHQPSQGLTFVHTSYFSNHDDIAKSVQKILQQKVIDYPNWTPPSSEYTNAPINCQICKTTIIDIESLLVCDACEKGTHLKCLQSYSNKGIPKAEWHCPRCLMLSNGKPLPPKYGRVTRNVGPSKVSSTGGIQSSSDKRAENQDSTVNPQKQTANGNSGLLHLTTAPSMGASHSDSVSDSKVANTPAGGLKREDEVHTPTLTNNSEEIARKVCVPPSTQSESSCNGSPLQDVQKSTSEPMVHPMIDASNTGSEHQHNVVETLDKLQAPSDSQVGKETEVSLSMQDSANQLLEDRKPNDKTKEPTDLKETFEDHAVCDSIRDKENIIHVASNGKPGVIEPKGPPEFKGSLEYSASCDVRLGDQSSCQATSNGYLNTDDRIKDNGKTSPIELQNVNWVGDSLRSVDERTYYQSCLINGVLHKVHDHVLVSSNDHRTYPSKLQSLWEDNKTGSKCASTNLYYFPNDLPEAISRPSAPGRNEVYASNNESTILASVICGPCEVLSVDKFREEMDCRTHSTDPDNVLHPLFMCRWMYDESKAIFQPVSN